METIHYKNKVDGLRLKLNTELKKNKIHECSSETNLEDYKLSLYVRNLMDQVGARVSDKKKNILVQTVIRVSNSIFDKQKHKYWYASVLAIESKFDTKARSHVGAQGIAQLMPQFAKGFAKLCGIDDYHRSDLRDAELNMMYGACFFKSLLNNNTINGNVAGALVGYNAGTNSKSFKQLKKLTNITNQETSNYVTKFTYVSEEAKNATARMLEPEEVALDE